MRKKIILGNYQELLQEAEEILDQSGEGEYLKKVMAVRAFLQGLPVKTIAGFCNVSERSIQKWIKTVEDEGYDALHRKKTSGRPPKISESDKELIDEIICFESPSNYDPNGEDWTGKLLAHVIKQELGIKMSEKWCKIFLQKGGYETPSSKASRAENYRIMGVLRNQVRYYSDLYKKQFDKNKKLREIIKQLENK